MGDRTRRRPRTNPFPFNPFRSLSSGIAGSLLLFAATLGGAALFLGELHEPRFGLFPMSTSEAPSTLLSPRPNFLCGGHVLDQCLVDDKSRIDLRCQAKSLLRYLSLTGLQSA